MITEKSSAFIILAFVLLVMLLLPSIAQENVSSEMSKKYLNERSANFRSAFEKVKPSLVEIKVDRYSEEIKFTEDVIQKINMIKRNIKSRPALPVTGFVISKDGLIATSAFNVSGRISEITVKLADAREFKARVAGVNEKHDLAILQIDAENLVVPNFINKEADPNTEICATGMNTGNGGYFLDLGIVTGSTKVNTKYFMMNIFANFVNSGAPIINLEGEILGMLNLVSNKSVFEQNSGVGFCLPIETIIKDADSLKQGLTITFNCEPYLGVNFQKTKKEVQKLLVASVFPNTGAEFGGIKKGDEIIRVNEKLISTEKALLDIISKCQIGDEIIISLIRNTKVMNVSIILTEKWLNPGY